LFAILQIMKVKLRDIREKMQTSLFAKGFDQKDTEFLINMYLGGELRGHTSHGLASFPGFLQTDFSELAKPEVIKETNSVFIIDAKSNPGAIIGKRAADEAIKRAQKELVGTAIIKNMDSWLRPGAIAQYIAEQGYVAIVMNDGGGASIAPPGGYDPVLATNPIAYGIPTSKKPLVVDLATSKRAWGQVRLANKYQTDLPKNTFYNDKGKLTLNPQEAHSVLPFGEHKGFALALMVEIMCGSMLGMNNMMLDTGTTGSSFGTKLEDRGGFILVIDPSQTSTLDNFKAANTELLEKIKATSKLDNENIRIPGEQAGKLEEERISSGEIDLPEEVWEEIKKL
jgi:L-2-hydroxycarboxylate dehydrogenase (NAD+)